MNFFARNKQLLQEILRFLIIGGLATIIDFGFFQLSKYVLFVSLSNDKMVTFLATAIGFIFGNIFNYIFSIIFVFKGAKENKKSQTAKSFLIFSLIGVLGLVIKYFCIDRGYALIELLFDLDNSSFLKWFLETIVYCLATLIVLIWNYIGRKLLIFKGDEKK